jgi:hypothetical protein
MEGVDDLYEHQRGGYGTKVVAKGISAFVGSVYQGFLTLYRHKGALQLHLPGPARCLRKHRRFIGAAGSGLTPGKCRAGRCQQVEAACSAFGLP